MLKLGIHFGHDAAIALVKVNQKDSRLIDYFEKERHVKIKHAIGISASEIISFLKRNDCKITDIDEAMITTTQFIPIADYEGRRIDIKPIGEISIPCTTTDNSFFTHRCGHNSNHHYKKATQWCTNIEQVEHSWIFKEENATLQHLQKIELTIDGQQFKKSWYVAHHYAHASYARYFSPYSSALIITFDGTTSRSYLGGGVYYAQDTSGAIEPLYYHGFWSGGFYERVGERLGFGTAGAAGKLMGLSSYGVAAYDDISLVGSIWELQGSNKIKYGRQVADEWLDRISFNYNFWDVWKYPPPLKESNIAASAQAIFERNIIKTVDKAVSYATRKGFYFDGIVLSGGCALNCPSNSILACRYPLFIPPAINDEGLAIGSAVTGLPPSLSAGGSSISYFGRKYSFNKEIVKQYGYSYMDDQDCKRAAKELFKGKFGAIFEGKAEIGPRALGHRSIIASAENNAFLFKINSIKNREPWRPLAPVMTHEAERAYFVGPTMNSYYMLLTSKATTKKLPAVTHIDGSARVQVVKKEAGAIFLMLKEYGKLSGYEVLINTSFNGRNEPIVETFEDAMKSFSNMPLDFMWANGFLIRKGLDE